jgi:hypothetical protein
MDGWLHIDLHASRRASRTAGCVALHRDPNACPACQENSCSACCNVPTALSWSRKMKSSLQHFRRRTIMGKYLLAWLLGVPAVVLVLIYLIF